MEIITDRHSSGSLERPILGYDGLQMTRRRLLNSFAAGLLILPAVLLMHGQPGTRANPTPAQNPEGPANVSLPPAQIAGELAGERVSNPDKQGDWPAIAYTKDGSLYAVWIEWNDKDADRVLVKRRDPQGRWGSEIPIEDGNWDHYSPVIVARPNGAMACG